MTRSSGSPTTSRSSSSSAPDAPVPGPDVGGLTGLVRKELQLAAHSAQRSGAREASGVPRGRRENHVRKRLASVAALAAVAAFVPITAADAANDGSPNDPRAKAFVKEV